MLDHRRRAKAAVLFVVIDDALLLDVLAGPLNMLNAEALAAALVFD